MFYLFGILPLFRLFSMASSSYVPHVSDMAELRANGFGVPIFFPTYANGFAHVSSLHLSIRFYFQDGSIWVERKFYYPLTSLLSSTMRENSILADNGFSVWELAAGEYRVYGILESRPHVSTDICTPRYSSASTLNTPPIVCVKIEHGVHIVIHLSDSSDGDEPAHSTPMVEPSSSSLRPPSVTPPLVSLHSMCTHPISPSTPSLSILQCLCTLASMSGRKNILQKLDYDTLQIQEVKFLPPRFDGNLMFVLPPVGVSSSHTKAKFMDGMDKRYDGHIWTKTQTTNITNDMGIAFRSSTCVGHLQCLNPHCDYLQRAHRTSPVNDIGFDGFTKEPFPVAGPLPLHSIIMCKICKEPPKCIAPCHAKIFYVHGIDIINVHAFILATIFIPPGSALFKYCKYTHACTKNVLFKTSMYKMYIHETYCYLAVSRYT